MTPRGAIEARVAVPLVSLCAAMAVAGVAGAAHAQPNLPPPPPPPMGAGNDVPSLPPPPPPPPGSAPPAETPQAPAHRAAAPPRPRRRPEPRPEPSPLPAPATEVHEGHALAVTWNPLGIFWGRLSANVEWELAPHHALVAAPYALVFEVDRGSRNTLLSEGFGFASPTSFGFGTELGYHYWGRASDELRGWFFGPSVLVGATNNATVGPTPAFQPYWGLALDLGIQEVIGAGFTAGVGGGVGFLRMSGESAFVPRILAQLGWTF